MPGGWERRVARLGVALLALAVASGCGGGKERPRPRDLPPWPDHPQRTVFEIRCPEELTQPQELDADLPVAVGCALPDCCPGCTVPEFEDLALDWRVAWSGVDIAQVALDFENLPPDELARVASDAGLGAPVGQRLVIAGAADVGSVMLPALPALIDDRVPVVTPRLAVHFSPDTIAGITSLPGTLANPGPPLVQLVIEQRLDGAVVDTYGADWLVDRLCPSETPVPSSVDRVVIAANRDADLAIVAVDGRTAGGSGACLPASGVVGRGETSVAVGNLGDPGSCGDDVVVLSRGNAALVAEPSAHGRVASPWTENSGDVLSLELEPAVVQPVSVWIVPNDQWLAVLSTRDRIEELEALIAANPSSAEANVAKEQIDALIVGLGEMEALLSERFEALAAAARADLVNANYVFDGINKAGVVFDPGDRTARFEAGDPLWSKVFTADCGAASAIRASPFFDPGHVNLYYVDNGVSGKTCEASVADANVVFVGTSATLSTLAHELGHALGHRVPGPKHGHVDASIPLWSRNLMRIGPFATERDHLSLGQVFRFHTGKLSVLRHNPVSPAGPRRDCPLFQAPAGCPPLERDWPMSWRADGF